MDPEKHGVNVVPYYLDAALRPHVLSVEQLQSQSAADLDFLLASGEQTVPSLEVCLHSPPRIAAMLQSHSPSILMTL